jgi:hypothetical protein
MDAKEEIHRICARLLETVPDSPEYLDCHAQLKKAMAAWEQEKE